MKFALLALATFCAALLPAEARAQDHAAGDIVILHGAEAVYTADPDRPTAEAFAMQHGRLLMVGAEERVREAYPEAHLLDAGGRIVVPGLIDAHAHLTGLAGSLLRADLVGTESPAEVVQRLDAFVEERGLPEGAWLVGRGWDQNDWPGSNAFPTREALDEAFPERPVYLTRIDGHAGWANTAALRAAGMQRIRDADDPEGGRIVRDEAGMPSGIFIDAAMSLVEDARPELTRAERAEGLARALGEMAAHGLTGVHEAGIGRAEVALYREAIDNMDRFPTRVYAMVGGRGEAFDYFCENGLITGGNGLGYGDHLTVRAVKFYMDGALGSRGAALLDDYSDDPGNRGLLRREPAALREDVEAALDCGFQVNTHAIGDRANRVVLDAYEQARTEAGPADPGRHRIEHAQILADEDIERFAALGVIASMQPTHATSDMPWAGERLGDERLEGAYAWERLRESGARLAFGSDFPVEDVDPLEGFYAAVTRQNADGEPAGGWFPDQRVSRAVALHGFTLGAAYAAFQEDEIGSLEPGKRADFVLLSRDIMQVPPAEILDTEVTATYLDGEKVYDRAAR